MKETEHLNENMQKFNRLCEAFEVLSDSNLKSIYDKNGHAGMQNIDGKTDGRCQSGYVYSGKCFQIFEKFFGNRSPFTDNFDSQPASSVCNDPLDPTAPKDISVVLRCTLFEFYNGSLKEFKYHRNRLLPDGKTIEDVEETMTVEVKPGFDTDSVLTFKTRGHEAHAHHQSYLLVKFDLISQPEVNYKRKGNNLIYTHSLSLQNALISAPVQVKTLDGRIMNISLDQTITP